MYTSVSSIATVITSILIGNDINFFFFLEAADSLFSAGIRLFSKASSKIFKRLCILGMILLKDENLPMKPCMYAECTAFG